MNARLWWRCVFFAVKDFDVSELFVRDAEHSDVSFGRSHTHDAFDMHLCVVHTGTVPHIDGELEHGESVLYNVFSELCCRSSFLFSFRRQVIEDEHPHDSVDIEMCERGHVDVRRPGR